MRQDRIAFVGACAIAGCVLFTAPSAQQAAPGTAPVDQPRGLAPNLGRPTRPDDVVAPFDFDKYFIGTWSFEADAPDSVLGPGGMSKGTTTYRKLDEGFYAAVTEAKGESGSFTIAEQIAYQVESKTAFRSVTDSRGFSYIEAAEVGGNIGGDYNLFFSSAPFMFKGRTVRLKHRVAVTAPLVHKVYVDVSTDNGPFLHLSPWVFSKHP
jgi:hypothetical protein